MRYSAGCIYTSVGQLCAYALQRGSLDLRVARVSPERLIEGAEMHRKLQTQRGNEYDNYTAEVRLENLYSYEGLQWKISGIADGIFGEGQTLTVEEIKTVTGRFPAEPIIQHIAQLRTYGYFFCVLHECENIRLQLTYYNTVNGKIKQFDFEESREVLRMYYESLLNLALPRARQYAYRAEVILPQTRDDVMFPFGELREGQSELVTECYRTVKSGKRLFAQAPTGIGKTLSVLYPSVRALCEGHCDRIFYLTAKASTRREAFSAAKKLYDSGSHLRTCVITARDQCCLCEAARTAGRVSSYCNPDDCVYARDYYNNADTAVFALLAKQHGFTRNSIEEVAKEYGVCPYELTLDLSEFCDVIICDYNYVFDPAVYLRRYFEPFAEKSDSVFLIDEAHNLPDRVRSMYSCGLLRSEFEAVYTATGNNEPELDGALEKIIMFLRGLRRLCRDNIVKAPDGERGFYMSRQPLPELADALQAFSSAADSWRKTRRDHPLYKSVSELSSSAKKYLSIAEYYDDKFLTYVELLGGDTRVRVFCLDPSGVLGERLDKSKAAVLFSATLTPLDYFTELCGGAESVTLDLPSPFPPENLCIAAVDTVSTRADDRNDKACRKIAVYIAATVSAKAGNYICYFPSYSFMEKVLCEFRKKYPAVETVIQHRGMNAAERESFLSSFKNDRGVLRIGFCVLGGSFSEGVDLPGSRLIGSIIIGAGIPGISNERNILRDYYDLRTESNGYDYAYTYPGMNAVLQAAGRVIRRDDDRGIVVLIDDRYGTPQYAALFPEQWAGLQFAGNPSSLAEIARRFWKNVKQ